MNEWAHLPNAAHIDWVLADVKANPDQWSAARAADWDADWDAALDTAWGAARAAVWGTARVDAWDAALDAALDAAWDAAQDAIAALVAWDDCAYILDLPVDAVKTLAACSHHPAVLLLPTVTLRHRRTEHERVGTLT